MVEAETESAEVADSIDGAIRALDNLPGWVMDSINGEKVRHDLYEAMEEHRRMGPQHWR